MTPFPSSSPRRGDGRSHAEGPRRRLRAREHRRAPEDAVRPLVPPRLSFSPAVAQLCAVLTDARSSPPRSSRGSKSKPAPRARTTRTAPPTPSHPRRNPNPSRTFPPPRRRPSKRPRRAAQKPPPAVSRRRPRRNLLRGHRRKRQRRTVSGGEARAREASETRSRTRPPRARPRACPRLRPRAKRRRRLGHPRASLGSRRTREPLPSALARWGPRTACRTTRSTRFARRTSRRGNA